MIIVSDQNVMRSEPRIPYAEFVEKAFGEGVDSSETYYINANNLDETVYGVLKDIEIFSYFSTNQTVPPFFTSACEDWSSFAMSEGQTPTPTTNTAPIAEQVYDAVSTDSEEDTSSVDDAMIRSLIAGAENNGPKASEEPEGGKEAKIYVFGSSKGGTGKTFTAIISTYRYAKTHQNERIALVDFDITDGQVGISIHKPRPGLRAYLNEFVKGHRDFRTMKAYAEKGNDQFPQNVDFYLTPSGGMTVSNNDFWANVIENLVNNYDVVVFDTGINYVQVPAISFAYKSADKILIITTTSIKSVSSVIQQINTLKGNSSTSKVFSKEDNLEPRLNVIITQMVQQSNTNQTIYAALTDVANVVATFGVITESVAQAEFYGQWNVFDKNPAINKALDDIMS